MKILVNKYGMTFYTRDAAQNPGGEQGETEGIIRHLIAQGHDVVYYGPTRGDMPCKTIAPMTRGLDTDCAIGEQEAQWEEFDKPELERHGPFDVLINVNGMPPTWSIVDNPNFARVQTFSIGRCAPVLYFLKHFKVPRIVVNNDPRAYTRDSEMSSIIPECRPAALLDQCSGEHTSVIGGKRWKRVSHYAHAESWGYLGDPLPFGTKQDLIGVISHAHVTTGIKKSSFEPWHALLGKSQIPVWGKGWEDQGFIHRGILRANEVIEKFSSFAASPVVSHTPNFYTGKPFVILNAGCVPAIYGRGEAGTWDPHERYLPLDSVLRVQTYSDLQSFALNACEGVLQEMREVFKPNFSVLDQCVEAFEKNSKENGFGGYYSC